jgi:hypothetical protein
MTLTEIKTKLGIVRLSMNPGEDVKGVPSCWVRHWENDTRTSVYMHEDTAKLLKEDVNDSINTLGLNTETLVAESTKEAYTSICIVVYKPSKYSF